MLALLVSAILAFTTPPSNVQPTTSCPADHPDSRELVNRFLSLSGFAADRTELGLGGVSPASARVLSDASDAVCDQFKSQIDASGTTGWDWTAYEVGSYYFVAFRRTDGELHLGHVPLYIFTTNMQQVRGITM
jgi:hypothetical protein